MTRNVTLPDRLARFVVGILLLGLYGALDSPWKYFTLIGLVLVGTALTGYCPLYRMLGRRSLR